MARSLQILQQDPRNQDNFYDSFLGLFGQGINNPNYNPQFDITTGDVKPITAAERISGIDIEQKRGKAAKNRRAGLMATDAYGALDDAGKTPELTTKTTQATLKRQADELAKFKDTVTLATIEGVAADKLGQATTIDQVNSLRASHAAEQREKDFSRISPELQHSIDSTRDTNRRLEQTAKDANAIAQGQLQLAKDTAKNEQERYYADRAEARQMRLDERIANKENLVMQLELQRDTLDQKRAMHQMELDYKREQDQQQRGDYLAAALTQLAGAFLV